VHISERERESNVITTVILQLAVRSSTQSRSRKPGPEKRGLSKPGLRTPGLHSRMKERQKPSVSK